jgi:hypothetical protein
MKRISQWAAKDVANKMRQKFWDQKVLAAENEASASIMKVIDRYIPSDMRKVMDVYEKQFGSGITNTPTLFAANRRTLFLHVSLKKKYPQRLTIDDADHDRVIDILKDFDVLRNQARQYEKQVEETLLQLKTQSKVKAVFPEANEFIQWGESAEEKKAIATVEELRKLSK